MNQTSLSDTNHSKYSTKRKRSVTLCPYGSLENCLDAERCTYEHKPINLQSDITKKQYIDTESSKCGICLDEKAKFGLLVHCDHFFCLDCIREWRARATDFQKPSVYTSCPFCRQYSPFIIPSNTPISYQTHGKLKKQVVRKYSEYLERLSFDERCDFQAYLKGDLPYYPCPNPVISSQYNAYQVFQTEAEENTRLYRLRPVSNQGSIPTLNIFTFFLNQLKSRLRFFDRVLTSPSN